MWLNNEKIIDSAIYTYRNALKGSTPRHIVIDGLFKQSKLDSVVKILQQPHGWQTQKHTYSALYVDDYQWQQAKKEQRFVYRDVWRRHQVNNNSSQANNPQSKVAQEFLSYLRSNEFMAFLSDIFKVKLTDKNVFDPEINSNYFRLDPNNFVCEHADDSPGREVCMLLYLNKVWDNKAGGELVFNGKNNEPINITPLYNRCVLFDPSSEGSEHWVRKLKSDYAGTYRYNVTSWYWSE